MPVSRKILPLNIAAAVEPAYTPAILVPDGATYLTAQFIYAPGGDDSPVVTMEQSNDGNHFDAVSDPTGSAVSLALNSSDTSATLNITGLLAQWIRFSISFAADSTGTVISVTILFR